MGKVIVELTISMDGYAAGPDVGPDEPLGRGGESLHDWMFAGKSGEEAERYQIEHFRDVGAVIVGRRMADLGIGPWGDEPTYHAPVFVVTSRPAARIERKGGTSYTFVTDGIEAALDLARAAAGEQDIIVGGGPDVARQYLNAGLVDEVRVNLAPMFLGAGSSLFDGVSPEVRFVPREARVEPLVTHLVYDVERPATA